MKTAIVTGGARGIGNAMTRKLAELGYNVVINYRSDSSKKLSDDMALELEKEFNIKTLVVRADVGNYDDCERLVKETINKFGDTIDVLVNNAGITNNSSFLTIKPEQYESVIKTNLLSDLHMCHLCLPYMVDKDTLIVNIASIGGLMGVVNQADYCASKSGVIGFSRALALEFASRKIRVNTIAPGMIMSDMLRSVDQEELDALASTIPLGHIGETDEIAGCLEYLVKAKYMTGQVVSPNGGICMQ